MLADLAVGVLILAGSLLAYYLVFRFGWDLLLRSSAVRQLKVQWRYFSVIFLGLAIGASSTVAFFQGSYWLALGLLTRPVAFAAFIFLVMGVIEHWRFDGYFWNKLGLEYPMIWSAAMLFFVIHGGGPYSLDSWIVGREF